MNIVLDIDVVLRMGTPTRDKPRPVIMKLKSSNNRKDCLRYASRLKGSNVYINEYVSKKKKKMEIRKTKMEELKEKRRQGFIVYFSGTTLITMRRPEQRTASDQDLSEYEQVTKLPPSENKQFKRVQRVTRLVVIVRTNKSIICCINKLGFHCQLVI